MPPPEPNPATEEEGATAPEPATKPHAVAGESESKEGAARPQRAGSSLYDMAKRGEATLPSATKQPAPAAPAPASPKETASPATTPAKATPTKPAATTKVRVPSTDHVRVELPTGLQATLDRDPRMQPWVNTAIKVVDECYARARKSDASVSGVIKVRLTMHDAQRPSANVMSVPSALSSVVVCTTGGLLNVKMPLFTGKEGEQHLVSVHFQK